jgi:hypothetical protein
MLHTMWGLADGYQKCVAIANDFGAIGPLVR